MLVAFTEAFQMGDPLAAYGEDLPALGTGGDGKLLGAIQRWYFNLCSQRGLSERDGNLTYKVIPMTFEERMSFDMQDYVEISTAAAPFSFSTLSGDLQTTSRIHPGWNFNGNFLGLLDFSRASAIPTRVRNKKALSPAA